LWAGEDANQLFFLCGLSEVHYYLQNIEEADRLLQLALIIYSHVHEHELIEPGIIEALIIKAKIYQFYKRWDDMFNSLNRAKKIAKILYQDYPHPTAASILFYLGFCEQQRRRFSDALNHYQQYLKIHENERIECLQSGHCCKTLPMFFYTLQTWEHIALVMFRIVCHASKKRCK
jgi:tetratricopeptide (TPR) repeat protein